MRAGTLLKAKLFLIASILFITTLFPTSGHAVTNRFAAFDLWPSIGDRRHFAVSSSETLYQFQFDVSSFNTFVNRPLDVRNTSGVRLRSIVDLYFAHYISASVGLFDFVQLGVTGLVFSYAKTQDPAVTPAPGLTSRMDLGDIRIAPKVRLLNANKYRFGLAVEPFVTIPMNAEDFYLGDSKVNFGGKLIADFLINKILRLSLNLGGEFRGEQVVINNIDFKHRASGSMGLHADLPKGFSLSIEGLAHTPFSNFFKDKDTTPVEFLAGVQYDIAQTGLTLGAGGGSCAVCGAKAGPIRAFVTLDYRYFNDTHRQKEEDQQALMAQTLKSKPKPAKYSEEILALRENCPNNPEDYSADAHDVGCPKYYELRETATLLNNCPENPEDFNPDIHDTECDKVFTLMEGYSAEDRYAVVALKENDRDGDGVPDNFDQCPEESEDFNGIADTDGCPEGGIEVKTDEIWTSTPVYFGFNKSKINKPIAETLCHLAGALYFHRDIKQLYVIGHADSIGSRGTNKRISKRRAKNVTKYIQQCGIPEDIQLKAVGRGEEQPIAPNTTEEGRQQNRRVIFSLQPRDGKSTPGAVPAGKSGTLIQVDSPKTGWLRVRQSPDTNSPELTRINHGTTHTSLQHTDVWHLVEYETGKSGWVSGTYVKIIQEQSAPGSASQAPPPPPESDFDSGSSTPVMTPMSYVRVHSPSLGWLRVRASSSKNSQELTRINHGDVFPVFQSENGWKNIEYTPGQRGWVLGHYTQSAPPPSMPEPVAPAPPPPPPPPPMEEPPTEAEPQKKKWKSRSLEEKSPREKKKAKRSEPPKSAPPPPPPPIESAPIQSTETDFYAPMSESDDYAP